MSEAFAIDGRVYSIRPEGQRLATSDPGRAVIMAHFADADGYQERLAKTILRLTEEEEKKRAERRPIGGSKVFQIDRFGCPAARLVEARARALFQRVSGAATAVVDLSWANVYRRGDYALPHSHLRAAASLVYFVDLGENDPTDEFAGRFTIVDPRLPLCAKVQAGYLTDPYLPDLRPGLMIMFPGNVVHAVNPYGGTRPRITMAWNINAEAIPGNALAQVGEGNKRPR